MNKESKEKQKKDNFFIDIHSHTFTISHAGLLSYLNHFLKRKKYTFEDIIKEKPLNILLHLFGLDPKNKKVYDGKVMIRGAVILLISGLLALTAIILVLASYKEWLVAIPIGLLVITIFIFAGILRKKTSEIQKKYNENIPKPINLLSIMENDIGSALLRMEWDVLALDNDLKNQKIDGVPILELAKETSLSSSMKEMIIKCWEDYIKNYGGFKLAGKEERISKYILTPLIVDFGYKDYSIEGVHYKKPPSKPVVVQVIDTFSGIISYMQRSPFQIFRIFPFMGINPSHYQLKVGDESQHENSIEVLFEKYFGSFSKNDEPEKRMSAFNDKIPEFSCDLDMSFEEIVLEKNLRIYNESKGSAETSNLTEFIGFLKSQIQDINLDEELNHAKNFYNYFFVGIKVYPPLGFDPWPDDDQSIARKKVEYMYEKCLEYRLPVVTHCNFGGFTVADDHLIELYTSPKRWENILKKYPELKVDFAHVGGDHEGDYATAKVWRDKIFDYVVDYENVYTDFSCMCFHDKDYKTLNNWIEDYLNARPDTDKKDLHRQKIYKRILYGTDFSINLLFDTNSYEEYLTEFVKTTYFSEEVKDWFSQENPKRFLFG